MKICNLLCNHRPLNKPLNRITQLENELRAIRRSELLGDSLPEIKKPDFEEDYQDYKTRLEGILSRPREIGFYDLISDLGAAMLTTDPTVGPFQAAGRGFANFNERLRARGKHLDRLISKLP